MTRDGVGGPDLDGSGQGMARIEQRREENEGKKTSQKEHEE